MRKPLKALLVALLIPVLGVQAAWADESKPRPVAAWTQLTTGAQVWILNSQVRAYECLPKSTRAVLSLQSSDGWVEVARSVARFDPELCTSNSSPYVARYEFQLTVDGQQPFPVPGTQAKLLAYQITYTDGRSRSGASAVYEDSEQLNEDQLDGKSPGAVTGEATGAQPQVSASPKPSASKLSATPRPKSSATPQPSIAGNAASISDWNGCFFNGVPMFGRVKVVSVGAQFKIRLVGSRAALRVKGVTRPAKKCGEWQFVSTAPTFTVEIVRSGQDFTVSLGAARPGVSN